MSDTINNIVYYHGYVDNEVYEKAVNISKCTCFVSEDTHACIYKRGK